MEKNKKIIWAIVFLVVTMYVLWPYLVPGSSPQQPLIASQPNAAAIKPLEQQPKQAAAIKAEQNGRLVDPFSLRVAVSKRGDDNKVTADKATEPQLQGIWVSARTRVAFISGQPVNIGSEVLGWRVTGITKTKVYLNKSGQTKILELEAQQ